MRFQRARKKEQIESRRQEILCAAEQLFNEGGLDNVTFSHIAKQVSFTRQTIYTYYQTREEVLLDLLGQRLEHFYQSLEAMFPGDELLRRRAFCQRLAHHFIEHRETLRLFSLRHTVLEENVRYENLVAFNRIMLEVFPTVKHILRRQCPASSDETFDTLTFTLIPYFASIYPILEPHPNQLKAICEAIGHLDNPPTSEEVLVASLELMTSALTFAADTDGKK
ncbi:MAG: TetR family transcriptional regulator [Selenomonadaceae bacterium]|nr:TetR family transcriptional regulator [Selenomonadaceae bacterium]